VTIEVVPGAATLTVTPSGVLPAGYARKFLAQLRYSNGVVYNMTTLGTWFTLTSSELTDQGGGVFVAANVPVNSVGRVVFELNGEFAQVDVTITPTVPASTHDLVSVASGTALVRGNGPSIAPSMSTDGNVVAFMSKASNFAPGTGNGRWQIFLRDRVARTTTLISRSISGAVGGDGDSFGPYVSASGRYIAFMSDATNLVTGDTNGGTDAFVFDRQTQVLSRVSTNSSGGQVQAQRLQILANEGQPLRPISISEDGQLVAFRMVSADIVPTAGTNPGFISLFVKNRATGEVVALPTTTAGQPIGDFYNSEPLLTPDGSVLAFTAGRNTWTSGTSGGVQETFWATLRRTPWLEVTNVQPVSRDFFGVFTDARFNDGTGMTADGRYIAFTSDAKNLLAGFNNNELDFPPGFGVPTVYLFDRTSSSLRAISTLPNGAQTDRRSFYGTLTPSGSHMAFYSRASGLAPGLVDNGYRQVYLRGLSGGAGVGASELISKNSLGQMGDDESSLSQYVQISADATKIVYASRANNLVPGDTNGFQDVFFTSRTSGPTTPGCSPADVANTDGDPVPDNAIDNGDFGLFFTAFFTPEGDPFRLIADIANTDGETVLEGGGPDGAVDNGDFSSFFAYFFQGCP
jgi:Tol biopolymer transport system component